MRHIIFRAALAGSLVLGTLAAATAVPDVAAATAVPEVAAATAVPEVAAATAVPDVAAAAPAHRVAAAAPGHRVAAALPVRHATSAVRTLPSHSDAVVTGRHTAARPTGTGDAAAHHTRVTRVLVILTYWSTKQSITPAQAKKNVITEPNTWYRRASYGRQGLSGTATAWVHVPKPPFCGDFNDNVFPQAEHAARRYHPKRYDRIVLYEPCSLGGDVGLGEEPGNEVILAEGGLTMPVAVHEQGHNYGLGHANQLSCTHHDKPATDRPGAHCQVVEYSDLSSAMAAEWNPKYAGDFTAPQKQALGWLSGHVRTVSHSGSVTLAPYETSAGVKAVRVPMPHHRSYWLEYRTRRGNDAHLPAPYIGVLIHESKPSSKLRGQLQQSVQLNTVPPDVATSLFTEQTTPAYLPLHSSWTTPDGVRFTLDSESSGSARVTIARKQKTRTPRAVRSISTRALDGKIAVSFRPPADDGGYPVTSYVVTASPGGAHKTVHTLTGATTITATVSGLKNGTRYRFGVRAVNERGSGAAATSHAATPQKRYPTPVILSPNNGASVQGVVPIRVKATHIAGGSPIVGMEVDVDDEGAIGFRYNGSASTVKWDTSGETLGSHTITLTATDSKHRTKSTSIVVDLTATDGPVLTVSAPSSGASVRGTVPITGTVAPNATSGRRVSNIEVEIDGDDIADLSDPGSSWSTTWPTDEYDPGSHEITVIATDSAGEASAVGRTVTVAPSEGITLSAPASGTAVHGLVHFTGTVSNSSSAPDLTVDVEDGQGDSYGAQYLSTAPGHTDPFDDAVDLDFETGNRHLQVVVTDSDGQQVAVPVTVVVSDVPSTISFTAPAASATVSGTITVSATVGNNSGADDPEVTLDIGGTDYDDEDVTAPAGSSGTYSYPDFDTTQLSNGQHTFTLTVTDEVGPTTATRTLTVSN